MAEAQAEQHGGSSESGGTGLKDELREGAQRAAQQATSVAESGKNKLVEGAEGVAKALHHVSEGLRSDQQEELARYTDKVADKLGQLAGSLRGRDFATLADDVTRFAHRQPALFLGGAFTAGLLAARFLKTSAGAAQSGSTSSQSGFDRAKPRGVSDSRAFGDQRDDATLEREVTAPGGYGPAPGGYGPASSPAGAHGGSGTFGAEGAGGGPGNDPTGIKGAAE